MAKKKTKKVVVIGLDGATWQLLRPWIEKGWLPNLRKVMEKGTWGELTSTIPSVTGPAWVTFATGRNPGSHGCYNFLVPGKSLLETEPLDNKRIIGKTFYEILEKAGKRSIIINLPYSFPPRIKKGILLPSFLDFSEQKVYPKKIARKIPEIAKYRVVTNPLSWFNKGEFLVKEIRDLEATKFKIAQKLYKGYQWDFFFIMFGGSDWLQHRMFHSLGRAKKIENTPALKFYQDFNDYLGWFLDHLPADSLLIILSDHGFGPGKYYFHLNQWLENQALLKTKKVFFKKETNLPLGPRQMMGDGGAGANFLQKISRLIFTNQPVYYLAGEVARFLEKFLPDTNFFSSLLSAGLELDMKKTLACSLPGNFAGIYLNDKQRFKDGLVEKDDYERLRRKIIRELRKLRDPRGKKVFKKVYRKEQIYQGGALNLAPDILFHEEEVTATSEFKRKKLFEKAGKEEGWHRQEGIFLAYGKNIKEGKKINHARLEDIAPTVLDLFGLAIPKETDGKVLLDIFKISAPEIEDKIAKSKKVIKKALKKFPHNKIALAWTGGKDSTLILWILRQVCEESGLPLPRAMFINEGYVFKEVVDFVKKWAKKWKVEVDFVRNKDVLKQVKKVGDLVYVEKLNKRNKLALKRLGFKEKEFPFEPESFVGNHLMKTVAMNTYLEKRKLKALIVGIRWDEQEARASETYFSSRKLPRHTRVHPILHFNERDVWQATLKYKIPYVRLYEDGYRSLGAKGTTTKSADIPAWEQDLEKTSERSGRRQDKEKIMKRLRDLGYM